MKAGLGGNNQQYRGERRKDKQFIEKVFGRVSEIQLLEENVHLEREKEAGRTETVY
jgi:hypothetical protein